MELRPPQIPAPFRPAGGRSNTRASVFIRSAVDRIEFRPALPARVGIDVASGDRGDVGRGRADGNCIASLNGSPVMAWFRKNHDPISARARALNQEIADLEA